MNFAPVAVTVLGLKINTMDHSSVVNLGPSQHADQYVSYKRNQGSGEHNGDLSPNYLPFSRVWDMDGIDSSSVKNSFF
ncbi:hypothetical protein GE107_02500 [Cohnella sp. CFH 77786]|uniref:spore germination protein n=1 Tax=Cohnella sp. CFH 77786 TaxID=2662265 RepID=UPI001C6085DF|nr:hypothetical protein [Cohnella sp. CFH 77786]